MTLSFLGRIADGYGLTVRSLLSSVTEVAGQQGVAGALRGDSEVFLNASARDRVAALCRVPQVGLHRALPTWTREEPLGPSKERPTAWLHNGVETVAAWGPACPGCVAARTGRIAPARMYLAAHQRVCPRHRCWLMSVPGSGGRVVGLAGCPEVVQAQEDHRRLLKLAQSAARHCAGMRPSAERTRTRQRQGPRIRTVHLRIRHDVRGTTLLPPHLAVRQDDASIRRGLS